MKEVGEQVEAADSGNNIGVAKLVDVGFAIDKQLYGKWK
jgi:hypothetical protein